MHTSDPPGAMALQMPLLPHSCVCKMRLLRACTLYTWNANTPFCVRKLHVLRVHCFSSECAKGPFCAGNESRVGTQIGTFMHAKKR